MNRFFRLLLGVAALSLPIGHASAEVFTVDDLVGYATRTVIGAPHNGYLPGIGGGARFTKVSASQVKIEGFMGDAAVTFTLDGNKLYLPNNTRFTTKSILYLDGEEIVRTVNNTLTTRKLYRRPFNIDGLGSQLEHITWYCYYPYKNSVDGSSVDDRLVGEISRNSEGEIRVVFPMYMVASQVGYSSPSYSVYSKTIFDFYKANAVAREYKNGGNTVTRTYNLGIRRSGNRLYLRNWYNYGWPTTGYFVDYETNSTDDCWFHSDIYADIYGNELSIPHQTLAMTSSGTFHGTGFTAVTRSTLPYNQSIKNSFTYDGLYWGADEGEYNEPQISTSYYSTVGHKGDYDDFVGYYGAGYSLSDPIEGTYTEHDGGMPHHDSGACPWVTNGGSRHTSTDGEWTIVFGENGQFHGEYDTGGVQRTEITWNNNDVTLDVDLVLEAFGSDNKNVYVKGHTNTLGNADYVDHYELHMVSGNHSDVTLSSFIQHDDLGHAHGKNIHYDYDSSFGLPLDNAVASQASGLDFSFNKVIPVSEIEHPSDNGRYSFYIKAVYASPYNLTPTFHDLSYSLRTTGIDNIYSDGTPEAVVTASGSSVVITGSDLPASVYTPSGTCVYRGADRRIDLPAGLYIVRVGRTAAKVALR